MSRNGLILAAFAIAATVLVVGTAKLTAPRIAAQQQQELLSVLNQLLPAAMHDNDLVASCTLVSHPELGGAQQRVYRATLKGQALNDEPTNIPQALALEVTAPNGYSGAIKLLVAFNVNGTVAGVRVLEHKETPGLGDKIELRKDDWILSFNGLRVNGSDDKRWAVKRDGGQFDAFTGATITPRAVVHAVKQANLLYQQHGSSWFKAPANCSLGASS
ncbi:electron transport complex subunit RsxG [Pseudidiomarina mangrovi]|uniref:electron transport complex subunit RsxG n=1 Tax=Pseudidiomarina mangrovi TaxID=2487133 RepID=UPI003D682976